MPIYLKTEKMDQVIWFNCFLLCFYSPHARDKKAKSKGRKANL